MSDPEYVLISTQINWACGPTVVGDSDSDPELMSYLNATKISRLGNNFSEYSTEWTPQKVLNKWQPNVNSLMLEKVSFNTLICAAFGVGITGTFGIYMMRMKFQSNVRNLPHYQEAIKILYEHPHAKDLLGIPIKVAHIDLADRINNYIGTLDSKLRIPLAGTIDSGYLNVFADRKTAKEDFRSKEINLEIDDDIIVIYERIS